MRTKKYSTKDFKRDVRQKYTWPGEYEIIFFTSDGEILCGKCAHENAREIIDSIMHNINDGWKVVGTAIEAVDAESTKEMAGLEYISYCAHCYKEIGELS